MDAAALVARFVLGSVFLLAALPKIQRRREFEGAVRRFELVPSRFVGPVARLLPLAEFAAGVALFAGIALRFVSFAVGVLLAAFALVVARALARGRDIDCGCFGRGAPQRVGWATVVRNVILLGLAVVLALWVPRALSVDDLILSGESESSATDAVALLIASTAALAAFGVASAGLHLRRLIAARVGEGRNA